ncbi:hypothetical protein [Marinifilum fragile]|uniref:hypothetical protein n=1 Tax=Marinifilum fragile TaxID=570161 RepID=UPI002AA72C12|nr:hypothetical protein [Marinifilum fragile]
MKDLIKKYWYIPTGIISLLLIVVLPIFINWALQQKTSYEVIGNSETWLSFWSTYLGTIIGSLITLYVLYLTLKQNEANNKKAKDLQIAIYKKGLEERRIQELTQAFRESLHFIELAKITRYIRLIQIEEYEKPEVFFLDELGKTFNKHSSFELDFISYTNDKNLDCYKSIFVDLIIKYSDYVTLITFIIDLLKNEDYTSKIRRLILNSEIKEYIKDEEYNTLVNCDSDEKFIREILFILNNYSKDHNKEYNELHSKLVDLSEQILTSKKSQLGELGI